MWQTAYFCVHCGLELTEGQYSYSHGRCPHCGVKDERACTFVRVHEEAYRLERINPAWKFWKTQYKRIFKEMK